MEGQTNLLLEFELKSNLRYVKWMAGDCHPTLAPAAKSEGPSSQGRYTAAIKMRVARIALSTGARLLACMGSRNILAEGELAEIIYILTNEAMPGLANIGITSGGVTQRVKQLDNTSTFECFYAAEVIDAAGRTSDPYCFR